MASDTTVSKFSGETIMVAELATLVEEQEIVRDGLFCLAKAPDRLDIYSVEGKSKTSKSPSTQRCIFSE